MTALQQSDKSLIFVHFFFDIQFLAFRLSLDFKEINQLHSEVLQHWAEALRARGAPLTVGVDISEMIDEYFFNDTLHSEETLRFEAKLLVDMMNLLYEWDDINDKHSPSSFNFREIEINELKVLIYVIFLKFSFT